MYAKADKCTPGEVECKLADFGLSGLLDPTSNGFKDFMGSDDHMAPEIISLQQNPEFGPEERTPAELIKYAKHVKADGCYDAKVDVWALGIIIY